MKRSLLMELGVVILMATGKVIWSIYNAGDAENPLLFPQYWAYCYAADLFFGALKEWRKGQKPTISFNESYTA